MKFKPTCGQRPIARRREAGFTLAEVLAALVFMAIVIPVAVQGIRVANLAGQVADRKEEASRVAERILNEIVVTSQGNPTSQNGSIEENNRQYRWQARNQAWDKDALQVLTVQVFFDVQGQEYDCRLSTLIDPSAATTTTPATTTSQP